jgi:hypothetical protein
MAQRCWSHAQQLLTDEAFMRRMGPITHVSTHVAFVYAGSKLLVSCGNIRNRHAEQNCVRELRSRKIVHHKPVRLFVTRVTGTHQMSRPCKMCTQLILAHLPQARVYYTDLDGVLREDVTRDTQHVSGLRKKA